MKFLAIMVGLGLWSGSAAAEGFSQGDEFTHTELTGVVNLTCFGGNYGHKTVYCDAYTIDPVSHDYFVTEEKVEADRVELRVTRPNGKVVTKKVKFDSAKKRSKKRINLWVRALFQKPLLHLGNNDVNYSLTSNNKSVREGTFRVRVNNGGIRQCRTRSMTSSFPEDCRFGSGDANVCNRYFNLENNCEY